MVGIPTINMPMGAIGSIMQFKDWASDARHRVWKEAIRQENEANKKAAREGRLNHTQAKVTMETDTLAPSVAQPETCVDRRLRELQRERYEIDAHIEWTKAHREALERIGIAPMRFWNMVSFHNPTRPQVLEIIKALPGIWAKKIGDDGKTMDYEQEGALSYRISNAELPPCCKLVEEWVEVPAQPATRVLRKVVKCPEPLPATEPELQEAAQ